MSIEEFFENVDVLLEKYTSKIDRKAAIDHRFGATRVPVDVTSFVDLFVGEVMDLANEWRESAYPQGGVDIL